MKNILLKNKKTQKTFLQLWVNIIMKSNSDESFFCNKNKYFWKVILQHSIITTNIGPTQLLFKTPFTFWQCRSRF